MTQNMLTGRKFASLVKSVVFAPADSNSGKTPQRVRAKNSKRLRNILGFTMLELMVVIAIIMILLGLAAGKYTRSVQRSHEAVLKQDLRVMRDAIQQFTLDKEAAPQSLDDLVSAGYMRSVPRDPITDRPDWVTVTEDILLSPEQSTTGISDVHSASNEISPFENTAYSTW
jgi:general secretion pathway protein G